MKKITIIIMLGILITSIVYGQTPPTAPPDYDSRCSYYCPDPDDDPTGQWTVQDTNTWCYDNGIICQAASNYAGCDMKQYNDNGDKYWCSDCRCKDIRNCDSPGECVDGSTIATCEDIGKLNCNGVPTYIDRRLGGDHCPGGCDPGPSCQGICACGNTIDFGFCCEEIPVYCGDGLCDLATEYCENDRLCTPSDDGSAPTGQVVNCRLPGTDDECTACGDGVPQAGEECDDGNNNDDDLCRNDCTIPPQLECPPGGSIESGFVKPTDSYMNDEITQGRRETDDNGNDIDWTLCNDAVRIDVDADIGNGRKTRVIYFEWDADEILPGLLDDYVVEKVELDSNLDLALTVYILQIESDGNWIDVCKKGEPDSSLTPEDIFPDPNLQDCSDGIEDLSSYITDLDDARPVKLRLLTWRNDEPQPNPIGVQWHTDVDCIKLNIKVFCGREAEPIPIRTCLGEGELYLYEGEDTVCQDVPISFTVQRDEVLIFSKDSGGPLNDFIIEVDGSPVFLGSPIVSTGPVDVYRFQTSIGSQVEISGTSSARSVQGYLAQNSSNPVYDISTTQYVYNHQRSDVIYLTPQEYNYVFFDKYSYYSCGGNTDHRDVDVEIKGPSFSLGGPFNDIIESETYEFPHPSPYEGAVVNDYTITQPGYYQFNVDTQDSIFWALLDCPAPPPTKIYCVGLTKNGGACIEDELYNLMNSATKSCDFNNVDGINTADLTILQNVISGTVTVDPADYLTIYDVNEDNLVNQRDLDLCGMLI